jgi:hypothetical protein
MRIRHAGAVAHQSTGRNDLSPLIHRGQSVTLCQRDELIASAAKECLGCHNHRVGSLLHQAREGGVDLPLCAGFNDNQSPPERIRGILHIFRFGGGARIGRVDDEADYGRRRYQRTQQFQPFRPERVGQKAHSGDIAAGPVEAGDETQLEIKLNV